MMVWEIESMPHADIFAFDEASSNGTAKNEALA
jgi:hypothetical protein